jgi:hypothetical protein
MVGRRTDPIPDERLTPDIPVKLQHGCLACGCCGIAVQVGNGNGNGNGSHHDHGHVLHLESMGRAVEGAAALTVATQNQRSVPLDFALCPACHRVAELAEQLVEDPTHRSLVARLGDVATHQVNTSLDAMAFLSPTWIETVTPDRIEPAELEALVRQLARLGGEARWISRFVPVMAPESNAGTCSPYRWAHLRFAQRSALRTAYGTLLRERVARTAPPVRIGPPEVSDRITGTNPLIVIESGCLFCGIGHQSVAAAVVAAESRQIISHLVWHPVRTSTEQLGGRASSASVSGYLCKVCNDASEHVHSIGPSALTRALVAALVPERLDKVGYGQLAVDGLRGWGALAAHAQQQQPPAPNPRPNSHPWEHLGDLDALSEQLVAALS